MTTELKLNETSDVTKLPGPPKVDIPPEILSPPTSRSNSPVSEMGFPVKDELVLDEDDVKFREEQEKEETAATKQAVSEMSGMDQDRRYHQLMHLLERSSIYTGFLLEKIKGEEKAKEAKEERVAQTEQTAGRGRRSSKRKKPAISSVIDKDDLIKRQRINEAGDSSYTASLSRDKEEVKQAVAKAKQPKLLTGAVLRDYQLYGVDWIITLYENGMNGILADEMGLGKTIQSIGVICKLLQLGVTGPFIIVVPLSTLSNWKREFDNFAPAIPNLLFHGAKLERPKLYKEMTKRSVQVGDRNVQCYPVVITSYDMIKIEYAFLKKFSWRFIIVDEGHRLKNMNCSLIKHLKGLKSDNRLLLTGTPLQNNLSELWSLLNFILPDVFDDLDSFQMWFDFSALREDTDGGKERIIANEKQGQVLSKLHQILSPFLLRRLKTDVELGIPNKTEVHVYAGMSALQEKYYKAILERRIFQLIIDEPEEVLEKNENGKTRKKKRVDYTEEEDVEAGKDDDGFLDMTKWSRHADQDEVYAEFSAARFCGSRNSKLTSALNVMWVQLKKSCNHPYLIKFPCDKDGYADITDEVLTSSGKMLLLHRMLPAIVDNGHKLLIFSTMTKLLDIVGDYLDLYERKYCRLDGSMSYKDRDVNIQSFTTDPEYRIFLLSTRAGGLGLNLMAADTVIILDSDWNPQCDLQAQDRAHRIGQKNPVMVYRFLTKNTMDQKIVERGISKRVLEKMVIHKGKFKNHTKDGPGNDTISEDDLQNLFDCAALEAFKTTSSSEDIMSDGDLAALVDRYNPLPKSKAYTEVEKVESPKY